MYDHTTLKTYSNTTLDRDAIRKAIRKALLPSTRTPNYQKQHWPKWLEDRLTTLAIYSYSDKNDCKQQYIQCLRLFSRGISYHAIARDMGLKRNTVQVYISKALDWVIDNTPDSLLINIPLSHTQYRIGGCPHCQEHGFKGDLIWDDTEGRYWCLSCSRYSD